MPGHEFEETTARGLRRITMLCNRQTTLTAPPNTSSPIESVTSVAAMMAELQIDGNPATVARRLKRKFCDSS